MVRVAVGGSSGASSGGEELRAYYKAKVEELELRVKDKAHNLRRLEAQRNELNTQGQLWAIFLCWLLLGKMS
jgi:hypothetical protein